MAELSFETPDDAMAALKAIYLRDGADAALRAARDLLVVGSTFIAATQGPDEAMKDLAIVTRMHKKPSQTRRPTLRLR